MSTWTPISFERQDRRAYLYLIIQKPDIAFGEYFDRKKSFEQDMNE